MPSARLQCMLARAFSWMPSCRFLRCCEPWTLTWRKVDGYGLRQSVPAAAEGTAEQPPPAAARLGGSAGARSGLAGPRLVMRDAVHLFCPGARHHHVLATEGTAAMSPGARMHDFLYALAGGR